MNGRRRLALKMHLIAFSAAFVASLSAAPLRAEGWADQRSVGPLLCHADFSLEPHAKLLEEAAELQNELVRILGVPPAPKPVEIYLFHDKATYQAYLKTYFPQAPSRQALFIQRAGRQMVFVYQNRQMDVDLRHETTHALLHASLAMVPLWLDEGLAEYFEVPPDDRPSKNPHHRRTAWNARFGVGPSIADLEAKQSLEDMSAGDYRDAWAWVHFMLHGPTEAHEELVGTLAAIARQTPPGKLSDRIERRLPNSRQRMRDHFLQWRR